MPGDPSLPGLRCLAKPLCLPLPLPVGSPVRVGPLAWDAYTSSTSIVPTIDLTATSPSNSPPYKQPRRSKISLSLHIGHPL